VIQVTDEMRRAVRGRMGIPDGVALDPWMEAAIGDVLALVEREYVILPRGAQPICCREHPDRPVRWGQCGECIAELPSEDRT
jgi:hypothetical protein